MGRDERRQHRPGRVGRLPRCAAQHGRPGLLQEPPFRRRLHPPLNAVNPKVEHIVFVINSYTEQELDDISMASCHLFDPIKRVDLASYTLTNNSALDGHTALLLADLYKDKSSRDWMMRILSVPSQGNTARVSVCWTFFYKVSSVAFL